MNWKSIAPPPGYERAEAAQYTSEVRFIVAVDERREVIVFIELEGSGKWREFQTGFRDPFEAQESLEHDAKILRLLWSIDTAIVIDAVDGEGTVYDSLLEQGLNLLGDIGKEWPEAETLEEKFREHRHRLALPRVEVEW